jgi:hypothetical protein
LYNDTVQLKNYEEKKVDPDDQDLSFGAFIYDVNKNAGTLFCLILVIVNKHKISTNFENTKKESQIGMSFTNSKSYIPMQFSSRDQEIKALKFLSTFKSPEEDEMQEDHLHNLPRTGLFEKYQKANYKNKGQKLEEEK